MTTCTCGAKSMFSRDHVAGCADGINDETEDLYRQRDELHDKWQRAERAVDRLNCEASDRDRKIAELTKELDEALAEKEVVGRYRNGAVANAIAHAAAIRVTGEMVDILGTVAHDWMRSSFDMYQLANHFEQRETDAERKIAEQHATIELLHAENAKLQRQVDATDAKNLALLKTVEELREEEASDKDIWHFQNRQIQRLVSELQSKQATIDTLKAERDGLKAQNAREVFARNGFPEPTAEQQDSALRGDE